MREDIRLDILSGNYERLYKTQDWIRKRISILDRDHYECQRCKGVYVDKRFPIKKITFSKANTVHHIIELKDDPSLMLDEKNLVSLCHNCHDIIHDRTPKKFNQPKKKVNDEKW